MSAQRPCRPNSTIGFQPVSVTRPRDRQDACATVGGMRILAISGSLRSMSSNTAVLRAARIVAPPGIEIILFPNLGALPHFNPDLDGDTPPQTVLELRSEVGRADGLLISSPRIRAWRTGMPEERARLAGCERGIPRQSRGAAKYFGPCDPCRGTVDRDPDDDVSTPRS